MLKVTTIHHNGESDNTQALVRFEDGYSTHLHCGPAGIWTTFDGCAVDLTPGERHMLDAARDEAIRWVEHDRALLDDPVSFRALPDALQDGPRLELRRDRGIIHLDISPDDSGDDRANLSVSLDGETLMFVLHQMGFRVPVHEEERLTVDEARALDDADAERELADDGHDIGFNLAGADDEPPYGSFPEER